MYLFSNSPSQMSRDLDIARSHRWDAQWNEYHLLLEKGAKGMISDFNKTKQVIDTAITCYLKAIENKFFRKEGRNRAHELQKNIQKSTDTLELMNALKEVIDKGNEDPNSLKPFLFKSINLNFCSGKILQVHPSSMSSISYTRILKDIIRAVEKNQEPICLTTFVDKTISFQND